MKRALLITAAVAAVAASVWAASARSAPVAASAGGASGHRASTGLVVAPGRVEGASENLSVSAEVSGRLTLMLVEEGDRVQANQVLARIDDADYRARLQSAQAQLAMAEADFARLINGARAEERLEARAQLSQAQAVFDQAATELARRKDLLRESVISQEELERADREARQSRARLDEVAERVKLVNGEAREDERARSQAAVDLARARVAEAGALIAKTVVRAPIDGTITRRHRQAGELVSPEAGQALVFTMADTSHRRVRAEVDESDVARVGVGQRVWVTADAFGASRFPGHVVRLSDALGRKNVHTDDPTERTDVKILETLVELDPGAALPLGLRVDVFIEAGPRPSLR